MLTENLWIERGLVNGALGTIRDISWKTGADWRRDPLFVTARTKRQGEPAL